MEENILLHRGQQKFPGENYLFIASTLPNFEWHAEQHGKAIVSKQGLTYQEPLSVFLAPMLLRGPFLIQKEMYMDQALNQQIEHVPGKQEVMKAMQLLPAPDQAEIVQQFKPGRKVTDVVWIVIVISFALVLIGAFVTLAMAIFTYGKLSGDLLLTVFTTAAAFLAGLLAPSPTQAKPPLP